MSLMKLRAIGLAAVVTVAAITACGDGGGGGATTPSDDGGADAAADGSGDALAQTDAPPTRAPFGLDMRPANATCLAPARPPVSAPVKFERVFASVTLDEVTTIAQIPGDSSKWFVAFRDGRIGSFPVAGAAGAPTIVANVATLAGMPVATMGEGGLLGMAFHPKFAQNGRLFVSWVTTGTPFLASVVSRLTSTNGGASFTGYMTLIGPSNAPDIYHLGGTALFGPDGFLYLSFGDGAGAAGQQLDGLLAKILRIDVDSGATYGIPADNPFVNVPGAERATYAYGLRNPFRFSFDRSSGALWVGDVGELTWEEVNIVQRGGNYGWPCREGAHALVDPGDDPGRCPSLVGLVDPIVEYEHLGNPPGRSITGGYVYRGKAIPAFVGTYVYGDFQTQELTTVSFDPTTGAATSKLLQGTGIPAAPWVSFAEDNDGELYALAITGEIYKLVPAGVAAPSTFPDRLSKTGCVDPNDPTKPAPGVIPYGVNAQLWSDGASKSRWLAVPDGKKITVGADGDFDLPTGSVLVKSFSLASKLIETRLFVRHGDGEWAGYDYEWNDAQTDALLLPSSKTKPVGAQTWYFPSRSDCVRCHTQAAGRTLGLELAQLNGDLVYPTTHRISNQLETLEHIALFDAPLGKPASAILAYPDPFGAGPVEPRARAYLHANCAGCHRAGVPGRTDIDLRFGTTLADTKMCAVAPKVGDLGVAGAKILAPGSPAASILSLRPRAPAGVNRMPPLASFVVDAQGVSVIDAWISSVTTCP